MTYKARTYDWETMINGLVQVMRDITKNQVPIFASANAGDHGKYPFIVYGDTDPNQEAYHSTYKTHDVFYKTMSIDCWAETDGEAQAISDDLVTLFQDPQYRNELNKYGITFQSITNYSHRTETMASFMDVADYGFNLEVQLVRDYTPDFPTIKDYGGLTNGTNN